MRYALLIYESPGAYDPSSDEGARVSAEYAAIARDDGAVGGAQLQPA